MKNARQTRHSRPDKPTFEWNKSNRSNEVTTPRSGWHRQSDGSELNERGYFDMNRVGILQMMRSYNLALYSNPVKLDTARYTYERHFKTCSKCHTQKITNDFHKNYRHKDGLEYWCKKCKSAHYFQNREKVILRSIKWQKEHPEECCKKTVKWRLKNLDQYNEWRRKNYKENQGQHSEYRRRFRKRHPEAKRFQQSIRRAAKMKRTPLWVNRIEIRKIYANCPLGMTVDHIIPLQGKQVSGLHVPWNLQYLSLSENSAKGNRTSQTCSVCGITDGTSREKGAFKCTSCKSELHADVNAAVNISRKGTESLNKIRRSGSVKRVVV